MAKHVINIHDKWEHEESPECPCHPDVLIAKDGDLIYVHEDYSKVKGRKPKEEGAIVKDKNKEAAPYHDEMNRMIEKHDKMLDKAIEDPKAYDALVIQQINNGILTRIDYLARKIALIEHGAY